VGDQDDRRVKARERLFQPLERLDVEMVGRLVKQQQIGVAGQRPGQPGAREFAAGERPRRPSQVGSGVEAEAGEVAECPFSPVIAARVFESGLGLRIATERAVVVRAGRHLVFEPRELGLDRDQLARAIEHVLAQGLEGAHDRALVGERDAHILTQHELAAVERFLACKHAQQGGLPGPIGAREGHALAVLELERDASQQRSTCHVLAEVRCDHDSHGRRW
jgi:hypothetical protein